MTRYEADVVVTMDASASVYRPGAVEVTGDRITWVGPATRPGGEEGTRVQLSGLLMPGLVNTHGHSAMTILRGAGDGLPLDRWLREVVWPREAKFTEGDVRWGTLLGCAELLRAGVTTTCEQYPRSDAVAAAVLDAGIRCVCTPGIFDLPGTDLTWKRCLDDAIRLHEELDGRDGRLTFGFGPHSAYALPEDALVTVAEVAKALDALVQIHVAETREEDAPVRERHGCSTPELLARLGVLECRVLAAHSVWLSDGDLALYAAHDVAVAHCPQSNGKLGSGVARVADMLARGIRVGLGTDGPASNDNLDLWEELRLAPVLARATALDPAAMTSLEALSLATRGGARALGVDAGSLEPGRLADMIRLDLDDVAFSPGLSDNDLIAHLVWSASNRQVTDVWVGGRQVVASSRCTNVVESEACREVAARARRLAAA